LERPENAAWRDNKKVREFKKRVTDEDNDTEKHFISIRFRNSRCQKRDSMLDV
jgi:hypothetical protein